VGCALEFLDDRSELSLVCKINAVNPLPVCQSTVTNTGVDHFTSCTCWKGCFGWRSDKQGLLHKGTIV